MPISVRYKNITDQDCIIRPAPLVAVNESVIRNKAGVLGKTYSITLNGWIIGNQGFPFARTTAGDLFQVFDVDGVTKVAASANAGPYTTFDTTQSHYGDNRPKQQYVPYEESVQAIMFKQKVLKALFATDGQRMEISPISNDEPAVICYPRLVGDVVFTEGIYVDTCQYTINLECDALYNAAEEMDIDGHPISYSRSLSDTDSLMKSEGLTYQDIIDMSGRFIDSFDDSWTLEFDDSLGNSKDLTRSYRISRTMSAVGKDTYGPGDLSNGLITSSKLAAWEQAKDFVHYKLQNESYGDYPNFMGYIGRGVVNLVEDYQGYNHTRTENISVSDGSYSITENWLLSSGTAYENYEMSIGASIDSAFVEVSINGNIQGLSSIAPSGEIYGGNDSGVYNSAYQNALQKYYDISTSGKFGVGSDIFKRADNAVAVKLNAQPKSVSVSLNEYAGTINYALAFDNRPSNIISGVLTETIDVSDTYPGDVFAVIPVLGRATGPVLQNIGGRTEYNRDVSISLLLDYTDIPYGSGRQSLMLQKPTVIEPTRTQLKTLIKELSPEFEPGIRKWFLKPPQEQWNPKTGSWSLSISWVYELDV